MVLDVATIRRSQGKKANRAVGYVRMSTSKQDLSPGVQGAALERWAASEGYELVATYFDLGVSGGADIADRPGLALALGQLSAQGADALVVAKRDRLARDVGIASEIERLASKAGARVLSADGWGNGDDDSAALMRDLGSVLGAHERRQIKRRTRDALALKKARGERVGGIPYGHRLAADGVHLEAEPTEQEVMGRAKALSDHGLTIRAIAAQLAAEGVVGRTGRPLSHAQVHRFLRPLLVAEAHS
jgi:DNA invertase Pin-like site-specific DNA recombinase